MTLKRDKDSDGISDKQCIIIVLKSELLGLEHCNHGNNRE